jgi:spermidine synthase
MVEIGLIGLGTGGLAAYGESGQRMTYFEIDAAVQGMAEDTRYFTFLSEARNRGVDARVILGDARLTLNAYDGPPLDLLILDAFSSDAIPVHLLTREAVALYVSRLSRNGVIVSHISNRYLNLRPVVATIATELGLACAINDDVKVTQAQMNETGHAASTWVALARTAEDLSPLRIGAADSPWKNLASPPQSRVWTDDYVNIIGAMKWR